MGASQSVAMERVFSDERMGVPWKDRQRLVVSIDVGATHSAVVVAVLQPGKIPSIQQISHWPGQESQVFDGKVPSILLYNDLGDFVSAGAEASIRYRGAADTSQGSRVQYFKLHLHKQSLDPTKPEEQFLPRRLEEFPRKVTLELVYRDYLAYLLGHTKRRLLEITGEDIWEQLRNEAEVVLTHPNLWSNSVRGFLTKAAVQAQLISSDRASTNLHFIEEAEAAARYCVSKYQSGFGTLKPTNRIMVCDAGGSTVDITTYDVNQSKVKGSVDGNIVLKEVNTVCVGTGGIHVDVAVENMLSRLLADSDPAEGVTKAEVIAEAVADFEAYGKRTFRSRNEVCKVQVGSRGWTDPKLKISRGLLFIDGNEVAETIFGPTVDKITTSVSEQLKKVGPKVDFIILTGGFGDSQYLRDQFQTKFLASNRKVLLPDDRSSLKPVALGALMLAVGGGMIQVKRKSLRSKFRFF